MAHGTVTVGAVQIAALCDVVGDFPVALGLALPGSSGRRGSRTGGNILRRSAGADRQLRDWGQPPGQDQCGQDLDARIQAEADQAHRPGRHPGGHGHGALDRVPTDGQPVQQPPLRTAEARTDGLGPMGPRGMVVMDGARGGPGTRGCRARPGPARNDSEPSTSSRRRCGRARTQLYRAAMPAAPYYAQAFAPLPSRCFWMVGHPGDTGPTHRPEPVAWRGSWRAPSGRRYRVEAGPLASTGPGQRPGRLAAPRVVPAGAAVQREAAAHGWMPTSWRASCRSRQSRRATIRPSRTVNTL
jgi:hypothetical protein